MAGRSGLQGLESFANGVHRYSGFESLASKIADLLLISKLAAEEKQVDGGKELAEERKRDK